MTYGLNIEGSKEKFYSDNIKNKQCLRTQIPLPTESAE